MTDPQQPTSRRAAREAEKPAASRRRPGRSTDGTEPPAPRRPRVGLIAGGLALAFLLLGTGAVFAGMAAARGPGDATPSGTSTKAAQRAVPGEQAAASALQTCSITKLASSKSLVKLFGSVYNADTKAATWEQDADTSQHTGSVLKVLTGAAAISALGPTYRITTQVVDGVVPGSITLVGHGDATLSRLASGKQSVYQDAPKLATLAAKTLDAYDKAHPGIPITQIILDSSYWNPDDNWNTLWDRKEQTSGSMSEVTALQVDGDRSNPQNQTSPRSTDPVGRAGAAFVAALGLSGVTVTEGQAENGAPELASVQSQPVSTLVKQMLLASDNTLAEMLARIVSVKEDQGGDSASLQQAITIALGKYGIDTGDMTIDDGSGLSDGNAVPASFMAQFMALVGAQKSGLEYVYDGLPVAGKTGSLASRFTGSSAVVAGKLHAKSGSLDDAYTLAGYVKAKDGTPMSFAFYAIGSGISSKAQPALDALAAGVYNCGSNLSTK